ncbi:hypothetical protein [Sphingorhabdus sp. M41]|uniref:hypothetical protein n=1 Tax=Sphingorhabdus sp. M41 TaxID=1806885 RepID=UPI0012E8559A|nr:hypothetical protein [Sphingorhabdus sp. M41]
MQLVGTILWKVRPEHLRPYFCSSFVPLAILSAMIIIISPALGSEAFASDPATPMTNARATAVASAQILRPFTTNSTISAGPKADNFATTVLRRTSFRSCETLLGSDANSAAGATCELRLIEVQ